VTQSDNDCVRTTLPIAVPDSAWAWAAATFALSSSLSVQTYLVKALRKFDNYLSIKWLPFSKGVSVLNPA
jgi:hypothetical protein